MDVEKLINGMIGGVFVAIGIAWQLLKTLREIQG